jgi:ATP-binding cassette subfamily C protein LapB
MAEEETKAKIIESTAIGSCLIPLLKALNWHGNKRHLREAMPHVSQIHSESMFCEVMTNLNYSHKIVEVRLADIDERVLPCLFLQENYSPLVLVKIDEGKLHVFNGEMNSVSEMDVASFKEKASNGRLLVFKPAKEDAAVKSLEQTWIRKTFNNNRGLFWSAMFFSFTVNLLMLATPLYVMSVYDRVVGTGSYQMLAEFATGIIIALIGIVALHQIRAKVIAIFGARLDRAIGTHIFERLIYLSPAYTETATVGSQIARIKDFDRLRQFLAGPLLTTFFDLPYVVIAMIIIGLIAGKLALVPIFMILAFVLFGTGLYFKVQRANRVAGFNSSRQQEFVLESMNNMRAIKYMSSEKEWIERYRKYSAETNLASLRVSFLGSINGSLSDSIMIASGMAVLGFGAILIIEQEISVGAMIATMILIWRILAPLKTVFNTLPRLQQMLSSLRQINRLMQIEPEAEAIELLSRAQMEFQGSIAFERVSLRYKAAMDPALMGVEFSVKPGEVVGIVGRNGSGKSTILKVILGLYHPQSGSVLIDGKDIRQLNPIELRNSLSYVPQTPELFYGTITDNLRLGRPDVTFEEMVMATKASGIYDEIMAMPNQFDESLRDFSSSKLPVSFQQGLCLARAYLKRSNIMLLDEPAGVLDEKLDEYLRRVLEMCKGNVTLMMVSHRPSHLKICDKILLMEQGQAILFGPPKEVLPKIPQDFL